MTDELSALRAENAELAAALEPFADLTILPETWGDESILAYGDYKKLKVKHFRAAANAIRKRMEAESHD